MPGPPGWPVLSRLARMRYTRGGSAQILPGGTRMAPSLADSGAQSLVGSMGTDVWAATKSGFAFLLGEGSAEQIAGWEGRLESSAAAVASGDSAGQLALWQGELGTLLDSDPEVEPKLAALVEEIAGRLATGGGAL